MTDTTSLKRFICFSGIPDDFNTWKNQVMAEAHSTTELTKSVGRWLLLIDEHLEDDSKWLFGSTTLASETDRTIYFFLVRHLNGPNIDAIAASHFMRGSLAWRYLLRQFEDRDPTRKGVDAGIQLFALRFDSFGPSKVEVFLSKFALVLSCYARAGSSSLTLPQEIAFLVNCLPLSEAWLNTRHELSKVTSSLEDAKQLVRSKCRDLVALDSVSPSSLTSSLHTVPASLVPSPPSLLANPGPSSRTVKCWKCKQEGHTLRSCPRTDLKYCVYHKSTTHNTSDCRARPSSDKAQVQQQLLTRIAELEQQLKSLIVQDPTAPSASSTEDASSGLLFQTTTNKSEGSAFFDVYTRSLTFKKKVFTIEVVLDSGGGVNLMNTDELFKFLKKKSTKIGGVNKKAPPLHTQGSGTVHCSAIASNSHPTSEIVHNVYYSPNSTANIFVPQLLEDAGWDCSNMLKGSVIDPQGRTIAVHRNKFNHPVISLVVENTTTSLTQSEILHDSTLLQEYHERLGHCDIRLLAKLLNTRVPKHFHCDTCSLCKVQRHFIHRESTYKAKQPLDKVHVDIFGPCRTVGYASAQYIICFIDSYTRLKKFYCMARKSDAPDKLLRFIQDMGQPRIIRADNAKEFTDGRFAHICLQKGISQEFSAPYTPQQNGVAERSWRTLISMVRCMLKHSHIPKTLWPFAVKHAEHILNCMPRAYTIVQNKKTMIPHVRLWNEFASQSNSPCKMSPVRLDDDHLFKWGSSFSVLNQGTRIADKLAPKGSKFYYLGEDWSRSSKLFVSPSWNSFIRSRNYRQLHLSPDTPTQCPTTTSTTLDIPSFTHPQTHPDIPQSSSVSPSHPPPCAPDLASDDSDPDTELDIPDNSPSCTSSPEPNPNAPLYERFNCSALAPKNIINTPRYPISQCFRALLTSYPQDDTEPTSYKQAVTGKSRQHWITAIIEELSTLIRMGTFKKVKRDPNMNILRLKHVFKLKRKKGLITRYKDRCVVGGHKQIQGIDYFKTRANVIRKETLRFMCTVAAKHKATIYQADIKNAFPLSKLREYIYCEEPDGVEYLSQAEQELVKLKDDEVLQLLRSLYGLKQAGRNWEKMLRSILKKKGFTPCKSDPCLYIHKKNLKANKGVMMIGTYVDDLPILCNGLAHYHQFIADLQKEIPIVDLGKAEWFLSVEIEQKPGLIQLHQQSEIRHIFSNMKDELTTKTPSTPIETKIYNTLKSPQGPTLSEEKQTKYRSVVGSLLYISEWTRPDISFAVSYLSTRLGRATNTDWKHLQRTVKFLYDTQLKKLVFRHDATTTQSPLTVYTDSGWGEDPDDGKSQNGFLIYAYGNLCSWKSTKQDKVALSTPNAEYVAMSEGAREALHFQNLILECTDNKPKIILYCDNKGAIQNSQNELTHKRCKHIDLKHHFIKDEVELENIIPTYIRSEDNPSDLLTKGVSTHIYNKLINHLIT